MNMRASFAAIVCLAILVGIAGCSHETDVNAELQQAVKELEDTSPAQTSAPAPRPTPIPQNQIQTATTRSQTSPTPAQQVSQAVASYRAGNYREAVTDLHAVLVQGSSGQVPMTPRQYMALQDAAGAVLQDLQVRAANGDAQARQAIEDYYRWKHTR